jgi:hypothetical protein
MANNITRWMDEDPPNLMLAIDPGAVDAATARRKGGAKVPYAGAALFQWGFLCWVGLMKAATTATPFQRPFNLVQKTLEESGVRACEHASGQVLDMLIVEVPRIYTKAAGRPEDIVQLTLVAGAFLGAVPSQRKSAPRPQEWKGSIDGEVFLDRVIGTWNPEAGTWEGGVLNESERRVMLQAPTASHTTHVRDAIALGLWGCGRIGTGGVHHPPLKR